MHYLYYNFRPMPQAFSELSAFLATCWPRQMLLRNWHENCLPSLALFWVPLAPLGENSGAFGSQSAPKRAPFWGPRWSQVQPWKLCSRQSESSTLLSRRVSWRLPFLSLFQEPSLEPPFSFLGPLCCSLWGAKGAPRGPKGVSNGSHFCQKVGFGMRCVSLLVSSGALRAHREPKEAKSDQKRVQKWSKIVKIWSIVEDIYLKILCSSYAKFMR